jgi:hypothetical protein
MGKLNCTRCNKELKSERIVWLELSVTDGCYYGEGRFPEGHESQGGFPFGEQCAVLECIDTVIHLSKKINETYLVNSK